MGEQAIDMRAPGLITAWSAVSPFGVGRESLAAGLRGGVGSEAPLDQMQWPSPMRSACLVPDFSVSEHLGSRGTRSMDRATALAVVTVAKLLEDARERGLEVGEDAALVLGTSTGSVQSIMNFTRDSLVRGRPYLVNPAEFPNTVMNCAAGQCAIWHRLRGPNATIAGGRASGLVALNYALRLQRSGHATTVLCGAVEEFSVVRAWLEHHTCRSGEPETTLGEGCALLLLQGHSPEGEQTPSTEVLALEFGLACGEEEIESVLATCLRRALERGGVVAGEVAVVAPSREECRLAQAESRAVDRVLGRGERVVLHTLHALGEEQAASATFQILSCLEASGVGGSVALVTSTDRDGFVGCALLRLGEG